MMFLNHNDVLSTITTCRVQASEEELAEVEAATKPLLDTKGGILPTWPCIVSWIMQCDESVASLNF